MSTDTPTATTPDYVLDEQIGYLIGLAKQRHSEIFQRNATHELTPTQFSALVRLKADPTDKRRKLLSIPPEQREIAPALYQMGRRITRETPEPLTQSEQAVLLKKLT